MYSFHHFSPVLAFGNDQPLARRLPHWIIHLQLSVLLFYSAMIACIHFHPTYLCLVPKIIAFIHLFRHGRRFAAVGVHPRPRLGFEGHVQHPADGETSQDSFLVLSIRWASLLFRRHRRARLKSFMGTIRYIAYNRKPCCTRSRHLRLISFVCGT